MRSFIAISCLLAVASASVLHAPFAKSAVFDQNGYKIDEVPAVASYAAPVVAKTFAPFAPIAAPVAYAADYKWAGPQHLPVIGPNGVPLDTPEVAAGKVANAHAHAEAHARNGDYAPIVAKTVAAPVFAKTVAAPVVAPIAAPVAYAHDFKWAGPQHIPVIGPNGVPLETPEVAAGKVANAVAHAEAHARNGDYIHPVVKTVAPYAPVVKTVAPVAVAPASYHLPVIGAHGVPLETPEVIAAKSAHFAAVADAKVRNGEAFLHYRKRRDVAVVAPFAKTNVYDHNGYKIDSVTPYSSYPYSYGSYPYSYGAYPYSYGAHPYSYAKTYATPYATPYSFAPYGYHY